MAITQLHCCGIGSKHTMKGWVSFPLTHGELLAGATGRDTGPDPSPGPVPPQPGELSNVHRWIQGGRGQVGRTLSQGSASKLSWSTY